MQVTTHTIEKFFALTGAVVCSIISIRIWQVVGTQQPMLPLPGLYLAELPALCVISAACIVRGNSLGGIVTWANTGVVFAFILLGAFSVGFLYLPIVLLLAVTATIWDIREKQNLFVHLGVFLIAGVAQVALMLAAIRLLNPNAIL